MKKYNEITSEECSELGSKEKGFHTEVECPECDGHLVIRVGRSKFLGCSNFPKCKATLSFATRRCDQMINKQIIGAAFERRDHEFDTSFIDDCNEIGATQYDFF